ncbi:S-layer homology domain-containing protein [Marinitoga litoralis]|uniref:S-layer homology domain-containing protein n=1 Tax=Marinitoga litoralis TaxID=570855 RepID=UPI00195FDC46|nr:S-layer homology domain-containing protein [Marinitoga litoralis]MBM7558513.1 hypothetical protein [Marinitoga litoralis]
MRKTLLVVALVLFGVLSFAFKDVPADHWAYDYVMDLANRGILPMEDNFNPDVVLTKAEIAVLLSDTLTYLENDPVLAKAEDIKRVEEVMKMLDMKLGDVAFSVEALKGEIDNVKTANARNFLELKYTVLDLSDRLNVLPQLKDDVAVNIENIDGLWEELDMVKSDLDYVSGMNVKEHEMLKDMLAGKADKEELDALSKDLTKAMNELETLTKVAYRAFNNADMILEDMLAMQEDLYELEEKVNEVSPAKLGAIESAVTANQNVLITLSKSNKELAGKVEMHEEKLNTVEDSASKANIMSLVALLVAGVALVVPFVVK